MKNIIPYSEAIDFVDKKLQQLSGVKRPQCKFIKHLFVLFWTINTRINFLRMGRYSDLNEKTFRNQFGKPFDFAPFYAVVLESKKGQEMIAAFDPSFICKSGKATHGLGQFWNGKGQKSEKGLEIGCLAMVDVSEETAYHLHAVQTEVPTEGCNQIDQYVKMIMDNRTRILDYTKYLAVDAYFMKKDFIEPLTKAGLQIITKMRCDANLRELYVAPDDVAAKKGRPKKYGPKVVLKGIDKSKWTLCLDTDEMKGYEMIAYCVTLKAFVKVVYLEKDGGKSYAVLLSTDKELAGKTIIKYYQLRFQIEFLIRDAKQFGGLEDCLARDKKMLHFHFNMALGSVSIAKLTMWSTLENKMNVPFSMHNIKQVFFNKHIAENIIINLGLDMSCEKIKTVFDNCLQIGRIAA